MKIAFIDTLGLTYDGSTLSKRGLGGSESAVIRMSQELAKIGFEVTVYNDCMSDDSSPGNYSGVEYLHINAARYEEYVYDVVIVSRSVRPYIENWEACTRARHKVLWMHDTFCEGDNDIETLILQGRINEIFTLSDWHTAYVTHADHGRRRNFDVLKNHIFLTRNGIGNMNPGWIDIREKDPDLFVFNASVTKGMVPLVKDIWPRVKQSIPQAKLKVIGGYYRFRSDHGPDQQEKDWRQMVEDHPEIEFTGVIPQQEISEILRKASYMIYPAAFPETYGISTLEALAHNVPLITCRFGALEETALDIASYKIPYPVEPNWSLPWLDKRQQVEHFASAVIYAYNNKYLHQQKMYACNQVKDICGWDSVALQWKQHLYKKLGEFLPIDDYRKVSKINHKVRKTFGRRFMNEEELVEPNQGPYNHFLVVTPVYNAENYISKCILSVAQQDYPMYTMYIVDDCSTDKTVQVIEDTIRSLPEEVQRNFIWVKNKDNLGAVWNQVNTIAGSDDHDVVMLLDGDDWLINDPNIFHKYNNLYNEGAEFTYGSCWSLVDNIPLIAQEYPPEVKADKTYRDYKFNWNMPYTHLRTFRAKLMHDYLAERGNYAFRDEDGNWLKAGGDTAIFYTMIERADPENVICVPDIVYNYNDMNPLNDYKVNGEEQTKTANKVLKKRDDNVKKILIAIPTAKYVECDTFKSIYDLEVPEGYETYFQCFYGYQVDQVRNLIADWVVKGYDYLFAVDGDVTFAPDTLKKMLEHDKDYVSGIYRQRLEPQAIEIYDLKLKRMNYEDIRGRGLVEIGASGFGCVLVKREVFEKVGYPYYVYYSALDHSKTFSEDLDFCSKALAKGAQLYCDTSILCGHLGSKMFVVESPPQTNHDPVLKRLEELHDQPLLPEDHVKYLWDMRYNQFIEPKVIYDIGACVLHWTNRAKEVWPHAKIIPMDAMDKVAELYYEKGFDTYVTCLLSDKEEEVEFYENLEHPGGNSLFKENNQLSPLADELFPEDKKIKKKAYTLDDIVETMNLPKPDLIKMDIQGAELKVLMGAQETLKSCNHLILELQHLDYNFGAPKADEVIAYLKEIGFDMVGDGMFCGSELGVDGDYHFIRRQPPQQIFSYSVVSE